MPVLSLSRLLFVADPLLSLLPACSHHARPRVARRVGPDPSCLDDRPERDDDHLSGHLDGPQHCRPGRVQFVLPPSRHLDPQLTLPCPHHPRRCRPRFADRQAPLWPGCRLVARPDDDQHRPTPAAVGPRRRARPPDDDRGHQQRRQGWRSRPPGECEARGRQGCRARQDGVQ